MSSGNSQESWNDVEDTCTLSNFEQVAVTHISMSLKVDFDALKLVGDVALTCNVLADGATELVLDTAHLNIKNVQSAASEDDVSWKIAAEVEPFGSALHIELPESGRAVGDTHTFIVSYNTTEDSGALQWLPPAQNSPR